MIEVAELPAPQSAWEAICPPQIINISQLNLPASGPLVIISQSSTVGSRVKLTVIAVVLSPA